jgi:hypothetical protein
VLVGRGRCHGTAEDVRGGGGGGGSAKQLLGPWHCTMRGLEGTIRGVQQYGIPSPYHTQSAVACVLVGGREGVCAERAHASQCNGVQNTVQPDFHHS